MRIQFDFGFWLRSDYHVSAGHGLGAAVDSALLRDADGIPVLRGTTVTGLLRDGLQEIFRSQLLSRYWQCKASGMEGGEAPDFCGQKDSGQEDCPVCAVFGTPREPKRWAFSSARPEGLEVPNEPGYVGWTAGKVGAQVVQRTRISPRTRRTEARKLFSQEEGDAGLSFHFTATCEGDPETLLDQMALLVAAARAVRHFGSARRRGRGECSLHLVGQTGLGEPPRDQTWEEHLLQRFQDRWIKPLKSRVASTAIRAPETFVVPQSIADLGPPVRLRLLVRTDEPVVVASRAGAGNQFDTLDILPGTAILGAFAGRAAERLGFDQHSGEAYRQFVWLFRRGGVRFPCLPPAYRPGSGTSIYPAIPAPLDLLSCKIYPGFRHGQLDSHHDIHPGAPVPRSQPLPSDCPICRNEKHPDIPLEPLRGFVPVRSQPQTFHPAKRAEAHITMEPETGRVRQGDLFGLVALDAGQYFVGEMVCKSQAAWQAFMALCDLPEGQAFSLGLGKANRRGYGKVTALIDRLPDNAPPLLVGMPLERRVQEKAGFLVLTLLTDAILLDPWGRFYQGFSRRWLAEWLGLPEDQVEIQYALARTRPVDTFNAYLGLPRFRDIALAAGSAVGIELGQPIPRDRLAALEREGIGLRREEAFGHVAFNHPVYQKCAGVQGTSISLPEPLRLSPRGRQARERRVEEFARRWEEEAQAMDPQWFEDPRWQAVARLLNTHREDDPETVRRELSQTGSPANFPLAKSPGREKANFYLTKGERGMNALMEQLNRLEEEITEWTRESGAQGASLATRLGRAGIEALANFVAAASSAQGGE